MTDLRHLAAAEELDWTKVVDLAEIHWADEVDSADGDDPPVTVTLRLEEIEARVTAAVNPHGHARSAYAHLVPLIVSALESPPLESGDVMSTTTRKRPTVRVWTIPGYGYLIGALTVLEEATAEELCAYLRERQTPYEGEQGWTVQGVARMLSWMQRQGYPVVRAPLNVARAYARQTGRPAPRAGYWRLTEARTRAMRDAVTECLLAAVTDERERRSSV